MIKGLVTLLLFQGLGELIAKGLSLPIPGPVAGLVFLLVFIVLRKKVDHDLQMVAQTFSQHLGLLFVPAAVGVVLFIPQLKAYLWAIGLSLLISVGLAIAVTAGLLQWLTKKNHD